jgi:uncharacterized protein (DUF3084 family)
MSISDLYRTRRFERDQRNGLLEQASEIRNRADSLTDLHIRLENSQRNLDRRQAELAAYEHQLRREAAALEQRRQDVERRERTLAHQRDTERATDILTGAAGDPAGGDDDPASVTAAAILRAGKIARGEIEAPMLHAVIPQPGRSHADMMAARRTADAILRAGMKARGEIDDDNPAPVPTADVQRTAMAIINAGRRARGELNGNEEG